MLNTLTFVLIWLSVYGVFSILYRLTRPVFDKISKFERDEEDTMKPIFYSIRHPKKNLMELFEDFND